MKKILVYILIFVLCLGMLSGCKDKDLQEKDNKASKNEIVNEATSNTKGNTFSNLNATGLIAKQGNFIYFTSLKGDKPCLVKANLKGVVKKVIKENVHAKYVNVLGDTIYYQNGETGKLCKTSINTGETTVLTPCVASDIYVENDKIYYIQNENQEAKCLRFMNTDGTADTMLIDGNIWKYEVHDKLLYYVAKDEYWNFNISVLNLEDNQRHLITIDEDPWQFLIADNRIYYVTNEKNILKSCNLDGSDIRIVSNATVDGSIAYNKDSSIILFNIYENQACYYIDLNAKNNEVMPFSKNRLLLLQILDDKYYYLQDDGNDDLTEEELYQLFQYKPETEESSKL